MPITDCGIPHAPDDPAYTSGVAAGVFMRDVTGQPYLGQVMSPAIALLQLLLVLIGSLTQCAAAGELAV